MDYDWYDLDFWFNDCHKITLFLVLIKIIGVNMPWWFCFIPIYYEVLFCLVILLYNVITGKDLLD